MLSANNSAITSESNCVYEKVSALRVGVFRSVKVHRDQIQKFSKAFVGISIN